MEQEGPSFWADIKKFEDTLERDPKSYCFGPLSELYRKVGMVDDAIIIAKRGCELHPEYVGGYMALGRAYFEKGMSAECRQALEKVVRITPDNLLAQRILSQIYIDTGEIAAAEESLKTILAQNPDDMESRILLNSLTRIAEASAHPPAEAEEEQIDKKGNTEIDKAGNEHLFEEDDDEEIIDLLESDIVEEFQEESEQKKELPYTAESDKSATDIFSGGEIERKDPLLTVTLAELYLSQGLSERAVTIYRELLEADPDNTELKNRLVALGKGIHKDEANAGELSFQPEYSGPGIEALTEASVADSLPMEAGSGSSVDEPLPGGDRYPGRNEEHIIHTLEIWLENIQRRRNGS